MTKPGPNWIRLVLMAAATYNLVWGCWVVFRPNDFFEWMKIETPNSLPIWQALGMVVGVYGIGYAIASRNPIRYWPIVLVGLIGKVLGPIGFAWLYWNDNLSGGFIWQILFNDLIWWVPFVGILYFVFRESSNPNPQVGSGSESTEPDPIKTIESQMGQTVVQASMKRPLMLVFLRHAGCTFCRQTLSDLQLNRDEILGLGVEVALVHMGSPMEGTTMLSKYELDFFHRFSDPQCKLYHRFGFERGKFNQLFSPSVLWRGLKAGIFGGHGIGRVQGDSFQLPGVVVMYQQKVILAFPVEDAAQRFDFHDIARRARAIANSKSDASADASERQTILNPN